MGERNMKKRIWILLTALLMALCCAVWTGAAAATATGENTVTLKLNGSTEARQEAQANERLNFTIEAPGATAVRMFRADWDMTWTLECWNNRDWNTALLERNGEMLQEGSYEFWIQARYDDYPEETDLWSNEEEANWERGTESNRITLQVSSEGQLPEPSAAWIGGNTASGLEWLKAEIIQGQGEWYWADVGIPGEEDTVEWFDQLQFAEDHTLTFPACWYEPGHYVMDVFAGTLGYQNKSTRLEFTITEPAQPLETALCLSKTQVQAGESLDIAGYLPEADRLYFFIQKNQDPTWLDRQDRNGPLGWLENWSVSEPGDYTVRLCSREGDNFVEAASAALQVLSSENGRLAPPDFSRLPAVLNPEEGLTGVIGLDERTRDCGIRVEYCPEDADWQEIFRTDRRVSGGQTALNLPAGLFGQDGRYKLNVWVNTPGFEGSGGDFWFLRRPETAAGAVTLTVNGGTEDIASWPSSSDLIIRAQAAGATAMRLLRGGEWDVRDCENGACEWRTGFGDGDYALAVQMTDAEPVWRAEGFDWGGFRWEELDWGEISNTVRVHVESPEGAKAEPEVNLSADSLHRGETLTVTVTPQGEDEWYWLDILVLQDNGDGASFHWENISHRDFGSNPQLRMNTLNLEPGEYWLQVGIDAEGWSGSQTLLPFTVLEPEGELPEAVLEFSRETMQASEGMNVTAVAPGCNHFRLEIRWDRDPNWWDERDDWGEGEYTWGWGCGCGGEYTFTLYYWKPGEEEPGTLTRTFTVISDGELNQPEFTGVPAVLDLGEGINGSFTPVDGAEWYSLGIRYSENGWDWEDLVNEDREASDPGAKELVFGSEAFSRTGFYQLWVSANAVGVDNGYRDTQILVIDPATVSEELVMRVEGETDGSLVEAYLHQELQVTVEAPEGVTAVRVRNSTSDWEYRFYGDETYEWRLGVHEGGANTFLVQASTDPAIADWWNTHGSLWDFDWNSLDWNLTGNRVTVNVIKYGDLEAPPMEFPNGTTVARGEMLVYRITPVENAWGYGIQVRRVGPDGRDEDELLIDMQLEDLKGPLLTALPTDALEPGNYRLYVDPRMYGWHGDQQGYGFTVTEASGWQEEPVFKASKNAYLTQEPMIFSAWAPGAAEMRLCYASPDNIWFEAMGDTLVDRVVPNWERVYRVMAYAYYPGEENYEDGNWVQIGETLEISVTAPYGEMGAALEAPAAVRADESWTMELTCDFKGTEGYGELYLEDLEGNLMDYHILEEREATGGYTAVWQVDAGALEPGVYTITGYVFPGSMGYALGIAEQTVTVSAGEPAGTLTVSKNEAEVFENIEVTVNVPGATAVGIHDGWGWTCAEGETLTDLWPMWDEGYHVFYGRYTTEVVNPEVPGFDWENVHWEGFTNAETVYVNPPVGTLVKPVFTVAENEVERGEDFLVTVTSRYVGVENVAFGAHLIPLGEEFSDLPWFGADENGVIRVNTLETEPGEYWLEVSANAVSWYGESDRVQVKVLPRSAAATVLRLPSGLTEIEAEAFAGIAAEKVIVPNGVTRIGDRAFADCPNLKEMELPEGVTFEGAPLEGSGPVFVYGTPGSWLEAYADEVEGLYFIPVTE